MFLIDLKSTKPIYEQIIDFMKEQSLKGNLKEGDKLPSVRQLASQLQVNPNTVSKAYIELERQKIIETIRGKGTFIKSITNIRKDEEKLGQIREQLKSICIELKYMGLEQEDVHHEVAVIYQTLSEK